MHSARAEQRRHVVKRQPNNLGPLVLGSEPGMRRQARSVDDTEKYSDLLVAHAGRGEVGEQLNQGIGRNADFLDAFAPRGDGRRLARLDVAGDDLDELSTSGGELRRQAELPQQHDLGARKIDRQHGGGGTRTQHVANLRRPTVAATPETHAVIAAEALRQDLGRVDDDVGGRVGGELGNGHGATVPRRPRAPSRD